MLSRLVGLVLPNVLLGSVAFIKGSTTAEARVYPNTFPARVTGYPLIVVEHDGSRETLDVNVEEARIVVTTYARTEEQARRVAYEVRDLFKPPPLQVLGIHAVEEYEDEFGEEQTITFQGAVLESGPRFGPDDRNRIITNYLVQYS
jgi:hypothetical protein